MVYMLPRWHPKGQYQDQDTVWITIPEVVSLQEVQKLSISIFEVYTAILRNIDICTCIKWRSPQVLQTFYDFNSEHMNVIWWLVEVGISLRIPQRSLKIFIASF